MGGTATDVAGEVVEVGPGVQDFKAGEKVVAYLNHLVNVTPFILLSFSFCHFFFIVLFSYNCYCHNLIDQFKTN